MDTLQLQDQGFRVSRFRGFKFSESQGSKIGPSCRSGNIGWMFVFE
jgi:hypothetical protein